MERRRTVSQQAAIVVVLTFVLVAIFIAIAVVVAHATFFAARDGAGDGTGDRAPTVHERACPDRQSAFKVVVNGRAFPQARCIDGSRPAFHLRRALSAEGRNKWVIHVNGGGWCYSFEQCAQRARGWLGSSNKYPSCLEGRSNTTFLSTYLSGDPVHNPAMYAWNAVVVWYCDGSSYAGDAMHTRAHETLYFRGRHNRDATIATLLHYFGMNEATHVVVAGCSAGGLGVFLGLDHVAAMIKVRS